ncbi:MAG: MFS transporter [Chloroflexota bacterium]
MKKWFVLALLGAAMFIIVIDTTIINVSISALVDDLNTTVSGVQSAISIYALVMAAFILIGGKWADIIGKKRTFLIGTVIFGIGTTIASFAQSLGVLILGWSILEGLGSALMIPNIQTILRSVYESKDRAFAYAIISAIAAVGAAVGPIVGGLLTTYASWRWAFRLEVVIVVIVLIFSSRIPRDVMADRRPKFDFLGATLNAFGWAAIVLGVLMGGEYGFWFAKQPFVIGALSLQPFGMSIVPFVIGFGVLLILGLLNWERKLEQAGGDGLFRPSLFRIPGLEPSMGVRFFQMAVSAAFLFTFPLFLQLSFGLTAIETGLALIPFSLAMLVTAIAGSRLSARYSAKRLIQVGFVLISAGLIILLLTIQPDISPADLAGTALFGVGFGLVASQILNLILSSVAPGDVAETAGLNGTGEQLGNALGVALVGTMMLIVLSANLERGMATSLAIAPEYEAPLTAAVESGVELMSDEQLTAALDAAGVDMATQLEVNRIYDAARVEAFQTGTIFLIFLALVGLLLTPFLIDRKLVDITAESVFVCRPGVCIAFSFNFL